MDKTNLPELTGSAKQISWANDLRAAFIDQQEGTNYGAFTDLFEIVEALKAVDFGGQFDNENEAYESLRDYIVKTQLSAKWWIEARNNRGIQLETIADWAKNL